tara:strand:+ start:6938 stop:7141 length:204 start_codon:yes stop_codon:yes gene_type:complete
LFTDIEEIKTLLNEQIEQLSNQIATGMCEDFNQYKHLTGMIEGLTRSIHVVNDYHNTIMENLEEDTE